jgi:hypothetical protein
MTNAGYIAMPRSLFADARFSREPYTEREAFLSLVADAAWRPCRVSLSKGSIDLRRGQLLASSRFLAVRWQWAEPRVRRYLARISERRATDAQNDARSDALIDARSDALIDAQPTRDGTIITIRKYDVFQGPASSDLSKSDAQNDAQTDARSDAVRDAPDYLENRRKEKKK